MHEPTAAADRDNTTTKKVPSIGVVCGTYKRLQYLRSQIAAIQSQTIKPSELHVFHDGSDPFRGSLPRNVIVAACAQNLGVWTRFFYAASLRTEYICIFDDDTIPGPQWFENALETHKQTGGLVGTAGIRFLGSYHRRVYCGWMNPSEQPTAVDIIGHSWFLRREWLAEYVRERQPPVIGFPMTCGEDFHLSFTLQKYLNLPSYVARHPKSLREQWGSLHGKIGWDATALWRRNGESAKRKVVFDYYRRQGWRLLSDAKREKHISTLIGNPPEAMYDIGVGDHSEWRVLGQQYPDMAIFGCEPNPSCFQDLSARFSGTLLNVAISQETGRRTMYCPADQRMRSTLNGPIDGYDDSFKAEAITLDEFDIRCGQPDRVLLWVDIEGAELDALMSGENLLASGRVRWINLEVREDVPHAAWCRYREVNQYLYERGFSKVAEYNRCRNPEAIYGSNSDSFHWDVLYKLDGSE